MNAIIESARKSAGISDLSKNYPANPKQRGCGFWAAFLGSLDTSIGVKDKAASAVDKELNLALREVARLEKELNELRKLNIKNGVKAVGSMEGWSVDKQSTIEHQIAG